MSFIQNQIKDGVDPSSLRAQLLGRGQAKSDDEWSTTQLRSTPVEKPADEKPKYDGFTVVNLRNQPSAAPQPTVPKPSSVPSQPNVEKYISLSPPLPASKLDSSNYTTPTIPFSPRPDDHIEKYLDRISSLTEMQKLSSPEVMYVCDLLNGSSKEEQIYLLKELEKIEGSLPSI